LEKPTPDLYLDTINLSKYLPGEDCRLCGEPTCESFSRKVKAGRGSLDECPRLEERLKKALRLIVEADKVLPSIPLCQTTIGVKPGLSLFGGPDSRSPVLVTGNFLYTQMVVEAVLAIAGMDCYLLTIDTEGYSVDMAVTLGLFTGEKVKEALERERMEAKVNHGTLVIPGLAGENKEEIEEKTGWKTIVGPVCILEAPAFLTVNWPQK